MTTPAIDNLPSQYDHEGAQSRWYKFWEDRGYFHAEPGAANSDGTPKPPYTIVIPPPNVTGALHLGHALNNTLQDILIRMKRMQGFNALWMPGTDHAGIATQAVVERRLLEEEKKSRHDLGREGLVNRIWQWKEQYEKRIIGQLKQLGASCDWERLRFTLDDQCARAVRETFFRLFQDGKIYRGKRLVNWDTFLQTAVSDDEVFKEPTKGHFWHFKYPVIKNSAWREGDPEFVTIATTRPETMLGDTAVAVHPDPAAAFDKVAADLREKMLTATDKERAELNKEAELLLERRAKMLPHLERLRDMAHRQVQLQLPCTDRTIPLIADEWAKPELGSGAVKITPAHDENDYAVGQRHPEIGAINIMNPDGTLNDSAPQKYRGLRMHTTARAAVIADMEAAGLFNPETDREDREIELPHSDRSKTPIEPYLTDQWFLNMHEPFADGRPCLADMAMNEVTDGRVQIVPPRYAKTYLDWLGEKRDWPIGRQLWWGHRIPIWRLEDRDQLDNDASAKLERLVRWAEAGRVAITLLGVVIKSKDQLISPNRANANDDDAVLVCIRDEQDTEAISLLDDLGSQQDPEVLDTWFSSALWPYSTMGWPDATPELAAFYPTSALVTSRDIMTLWVARMVLTGLYNVGDIPFHEVYVTPKILDGYGETMSKSKGNGVDPLDVIKKFGADALRYGLAYLTTETQDVKMPVEFECPHCQALMPQTKKNRTLPRVECEKCGQPFGTQWAEKPEDVALPRAGVANERFELGRRFANKLWNASRFSLMNLENYAAAITLRIHDDDLLLEDRWILSRLATVTGEATAALESYRYADASRALYAFAWNDFCDYYVEMTKARFTETSSPVSPRPEHPLASSSSTSTPAASASLGETRQHQAPGFHETKFVAQRVLAHVLDALLRLLHPIMPFLTEEVWQLLKVAAPDRGLPLAMVRPESVCIAEWPTPDKSRTNAQIEEQFADFQAVLGSIRELRMSQNIPPREPVDFTVRCDAATAALLEPLQPYFTQMARATGRAWGPAAAPPDTAASAQLTGARGPIEVHLDVSRFIDVEAEKSRLKKQLDQLRGHAAALEAKLTNENFVSRAPKEVVDQQRAKKAEVLGQIEAVDAALAKLR